MSGRMDWGAMIVDAPRAYQTYLVPAVFVPLSAAVAGAIEAGPGDRVLDVACGTGALSRVLAERVGASGRVVGLDLAEQMLAVARELSQDSGIEFVQGNAEQLPFEAADFTVVTCQQGLQFVPDRAAALREFYRVLAPGGRLAVACWCDLETSAGFRAVGEALDRHIGTDVGDMIRNPFVLNDPGELRSLVEAAGFGDVVVEIERVAARFGDAEHFTERLLAGQPLAAQFAQATDEQRRAVSDDANAALEPYGDGEHVAFEMPSLIAVARR